MCQPSGTISPSFEGGLCPRNPPGGGDRRGGKAPLRSMSALQKLLSLIVPPDPALSARAQAHLDGLTKPPGSLGRVPELARRVVEITGNDPPRVRRAGVFTLAGDHGVVAEGVSAYPQV